MRRTEPGWECDPAPRSTGSPSSIVSPSLNLPLVQLGSLDDRYGLGVSLRGERANGGARPRKHRGAEGNQLGSPGATEDAFAMVKQLDPARQPRKIAQASLADTPAAASARSSSPCSLIRDLQVSSGSSLRHHRARQRGRRRVSNRLRVLSRVLPPKRHLAPHAAPGAARGALAISGDGRDGRGRGRSSPVSSAAGFMAFRWRLPTTAAKTSAPSTAISRRCSSCARSSGASSTAPTRPS